MISSIEWLKPVNIQHEAKMRIRLPFLGYCMLYGSLLSTIKSMKIYHQSDFLQHSCWLNTEEVNNLQKFFCIGWLVYLTRLRGKKEQLTSMSPETNQYEKSAAKNKPSDKEIVKVDRGQTSTTPNIGQTSTPKKVDILIVLRYSVPLFKGVLTISKKFINTETNQYEKSAANRDELSDEVEIVEVAHGQTSTTPATGQVYQKNYRDPFVLDISQVLMESRQKSKTSRDLEESHTDKEMASAHFPKSSFEHTRTIKPRELSLSRMPHRDSLSREFLPYDFSSSSVEPSESLAYRYNNSDYEKLKRVGSVYLQGRMCEVYRELKEIKGELNELRQDYIKLHSHNKYINHENEVLRAEINNLKSQISSQDDADIESSESESNDNDNRPGKKRKVARRQIDQSDDDSETDEENARVH
ncbi:hypothetical protein RhiirA1_470202 [Rhizophagus irregularis]|uniref:Uncharacterized protein n=1 Tax=Rhizophagus irregularis TaxID=588596 RepID=A0A2N0R6K3_9GLOM|nr:hypothetical protein RhiirA1_470202 [Rhizophagus irregularis]